jgi:hypothetical protein
VFASLLDAERGGRFRVAPDTGDHVSRQLYFPDNAMLITWFMTVDGMIEVTDFTPVAGVRQRTGTGWCGYGRAPHKLDISADGAVFFADGMELTLHPVGERTGELGTGGSLWSAVATTFA